MDWEEKGIKICGKYLSNLRFTDDVVLIGSSIDEVQNMFIKFVKNSRKASLETNLIKTKFMNNKEERRTIIIIKDKKEIDKTTEYNYLGQIISFQNKLNKELSERKRKAWKNYWSLKHIFKNKKVKTNSKIKMLEICTLPVLYYEAQTWSLTKSQSNELKVTQKSMERSILKGTKRSN